MICDIRKFIKAAVPFSRGFSDEHSINKVGHLRTVGCILAPDQTDMSMMYGTSVLKRAKKKQA